MAGRSRARYLVPIALAAVIAATYVIVHAGLTNKHATGHSRARRGDRDRRRSAKDKFYVVKPGDSLTSIAAKYGISVATLESLNPKVDAGRLQTSQRLRVRR